MRKAVAGIVARFALRSLSYTRDLLLRCAVVGRGDRSVERGACCVQLQKFIVLRAAP